MGEQDIITELEDRIRELESDFRRYQDNAKQDIEREKKRSQTALEIIIKLEKKIQEKERK